MEDNRQQFDVNLSSDLAQGMYSNLAVISHSSSEFVLDFARIMPGVPKAEVVSRIIMTADHAKRLMIALQDNVSKYESVNGQISLPENNNAPIFPFDIKAKGQA
ncbi:hypothetical protein FACS1894199_18630 [Bacteroidia bacterium]|nr:hypothetical protein FACS1894199_18630 [Bacteroidia bacterium]